MINFRRARRSGRPPGRRCPRCRRTAARTRPACRRPTGRAGRRVVCRPPNEVAANDQRRRGQEPGHPLGDARSNVTMPGIRRICRGGDRVRRVARQPGPAHRRPRRMRRRSSVGDRRRVRASAGPAAGPAWPSDRWASQASNGAGHRRRCASRQAVSRGQQLRRRGSPRSPSSRSEWPVSALVPEATDEVGAEVQRALAERRGGGVVDRDQRAGGVRGLGQRRDVAHVQARVGRRLQQHQPYAVERRVRPGGRRQHRP